MKELQPHLLEIIYVIAGIISIVAGYFAYRDKEHKSKNFTALFWILLGIIFIFGKWIPPKVVGGIIVLMGVLTASKRVVAGSLETSPESERIASAKRIGNKLFIPALTIGVVAFVFGQFIPELGGLVGLGVGAIVALIVVMIMTKVEPVNVPKDSSRLLLQIGSTAILPQLLASLGALFAAAGVGEVIAGGIETVMPENSIFWGVVAYCFGMMIFTMIMGNAFAAFAVITAGIGIPFVYSQGANPAIAGALALTAGYCGTLMTPMAANFNIVPAAILDSRDKYSVIKAQLPVGLALWVLHVVLMYFWAF